MNEDVLSKELSHSYKTIVSPFLNINRRPLKIHQRRPLAENDIKSSWHLKKMLIFLSRIDTSQIKIGNRRS